MSFVLSPSQAAIYETDWALFGAHRFFAVAQQSRWSPETNRGRPKNDGLRKRFGKPVTATFVGYR